MSIAKMTFLCKIITIGIETEINLGKSVKILYIRKDLHNPFEQRHYVYAAYDLYIFESERIT